MSPSRWEALPPVAVALGVFCLVLALYGRTLMRGVGAGDVAEMQTVPPVLGVAHPTGYPLWTLIGFVWTRLPFGGPALLMNLLSAVFFAAAAAVLVLVAHRIGIHPMAAAVGAVGFAVAEPTWVDAVRADVHSLHLLLYALLLAAWLRAEARPTDPAPVLAMALVIGAGLAHHRLMAVAGLPLLGWFLLRNRTVLRRSKVVAGLAAALAAPQLSYLYLLWRWPSAPVRQSDTGSWQSLVEVGRGDQFAGAVTVFSPSALGTWLRTMPEYASHALAWTGPVLVLLALMGTVRLVARRPAIAAGLALTLLTVTFVQANRIPPDDWRYLIGPLFVMGVAAAAGTELVVGACGRWMRGRARPLVVAVLSGLALVSPTMDGLRHLDRSEDRRDADNVELIFAALERGAIVSSYWDLRTTLQYARYAEGRRPDVTVLDSRTYRRYGVRTDDQVLEAVYRDPDRRGRPLYLIVFFEEDLARLAERFDLEPVLEIDAPYGFEFRGRTTLHRVGSHIGDG